MFRDSGGIGRMMLAAAFLAALSQPALSEWQREVGPHGVRRAWIDREAPVLGLPCVVRLQFSATGDGGTARDRGRGMLALAFSIAPVAPLKGFDFDYFEGPDAPAKGKKLMSVTIHKDGQRTTHWLAADGWRSADVADGFVFGVADRLRGNPASGRLGKILAEMMRDAQHVEVAVVDGRHPATVLSATFSLADGKNALRELTAGR
ncbi:MAG: hypothetical protein HS110_05945 [Zoogloeaceae bacterium]|nr:hypothetical protein [Zoogloeaceae bacterium]MCK6384282.1 hypothetical protein [Rhodocyclaceae bacterium]